MALRADREAIRHIFVAVFGNRDLSRRDRPAD